MQVDEINEDDDFLISKGFIITMLAFMFIFIAVMILAGVMAVNKISPNNLLAHLMLVEDLDSCKPILNGFLLKC